MFPATGSGETGTVTFFYDGTVIGSASVSNGQATLTTATLPIGTGSVTATYGGDANFAGSATTVRVVPRGRSRAQLSPAK